MDTQELRLAILHKMISDSGNIGKTKLQKLVYFLQEAQGVPTKYPFRMHHYGPYAEALETDMARLRLAGYIDIQPDTQGYGFHIKPLDNPLEDWSQLNKDHDQELGRVIDTFGDWQTYELELAATIHFVKNLSSDSSTDEVLSKVKALKPKFEESYILERHAQLVQLGLLKDQ
jgi:uncharacterized protein YwgA